jgi:hypothetical protein
VKTKKLGQVLTKKIKWEEDILTIKGLGHLILLFLLVLLAFNLHPSLDY